MFTFGRCAQNCDQILSYSCLPPGSNDGETRRYVKPKKRKSGPEVAMRVALKKKNRALYGLGGGKPNLSRRQQTSALYVFPNFDKCDSLVYFPSTFTRHVNSGNLTALSKLLTTHLSKDCLIRMCFTDQRLNPAAIVDMYDILLRLQPDCMMCMHTTKIEDNTVRARVYLKGTESKYLHETVAKSITDPLFAPTFNVDRMDALKLRIDMQEERDEADRQRLLELAASEVDLVIYVQSEFVITFDDFSKKITNICIRSKCTALEPVKEI